MPKPNVIQGGIIAEIKELRCSRTTASAANTATLLLKDSCMTAPTVVGA